jgi:AsmA protein
MPRIARISLLAVGGLVALAALLILFAWVFLDSESVRYKIERTASQVMGMELKVDGPVRIRMFPAPRVGLADVHIRNGETEWLNATEVNLRIRLLPLLHGQVEITGFDLMEPRLQLTRGADGAFNFLPAYRPDDSRDRRPLEIRRFHLQDASLTFSDQASGAGIEAEGCDFSGQDLAWRPAQSPSSGPKPPDFHGRVSCRKVVYGALNATEVEARISAQAQRLEISPVTGRLFDGQVKAQLESDLSEPSPVHSLELELANFRVERFIETFRQGQGVEGPARFSMRLESSGRTLSEVLEHLGGQATLSGTGLVLHGRDLDAQLAQYESTQSFDLVDTAALFLAGPAGLVVTQGYGFASIFAETGDQTKIQELISEWRIENGIARAHDVALSTVENRLALAGGLNFVTSEFEDLRVAVIDADGCAVVEQRIRGRFEDPRIEKPNFLVSLASPLLELVKRGIALLSESDCEPFYTGRVEPP